MWNRRAKHCPLCGHRLTDGIVEGVPRPRCSECAFVLYQNPAAASAAVVLTPAQEVLLIRRRIQPHLGSWALPAGYQEIDEAPHLTAAREVREEAGVEVVVVRLLDLLFVADDPRKPANVAVFLCRPAGGVLRAGSDAQDAAYFPLSGLPEPMGFDNNRRILERLANEPGYANARLPGDFDPPPSGGST